MINARLTTLKAQVAELELKAELLEDFQTITNGLRENFKSMNYIRRYSYIGPRTQRTSFYGSRFLSDSTIYRMKNMVEANIPGYTVSRAKTGDVAVYYNN
jgi:hypothetical protein